MALWYLINELKPNSAARNMAIDEYLFNLCHQKKVGFFRIYGWKFPTFSFGVSQKIEKVLNLNYIKTNKFEFVRRITGGKVVLHEDEITYAVISSENVFFRDNDLYRSYMLISTILVNAFNRLGIKAYLSKGSSSQQSRSNNPCFSFPTPHELEIDGKKIVGSAQKRDQNALLQHGSIPITMDFEKYASATHFQEKIIKRSMTTLNDVCNVSKSQLVDSLIHNFEGFIRMPLEVFEFDAKDNKNITELEQKYTSKNWNYRL